MKNVRNAVVAGLVLAVTIAPAPSAAAQDLETRTQRVKELVEATGSTVFVTPAPGSRSTILAVDVSTSLFFFLERGSLRGDSTQAFYDAYEAGDMATAYEVFSANALMTVRATDYGWNGFGVPMTAASGNEVADILFKNMEGTFRRAAEITAEDLASYEEMLDAVLAALEGS